MENTADCTVEDTAKWMQTHLRKHLNDEKLVLKTVNQLEMEFGNSYTSKIIKVKVTGTRGDGSPYVKSFVWKELCLESPGGRLTDVNLLYRIEGHLYTKVLPVLGPYGPVCVHQDKRNVVTEDLSEMGYVNCFVRTYMDLDHTILTLKALAKFHASSLALKINDPRRFDEIVTPIQEVIFTESPTLMRQYIVDTSMSTSNNLEFIKPQTQALQTIANFLTSRKHEFYEDFRQLLSAPKQKYSTICHGDVWVNNLLFLYDDNNKPIDVKFIDYQTVRYASVALDIHNFIYSSVSSSLIENSYESLIKIYHSTLLKELRQLHVSEVVLAELDKEWLEEGLKIYSLFSMFIGCWIVHLVLANDEDLKMYEKLSNIDLNYVKPNKLYKERFDRISCIVSHYYNRYHLGIIRGDLEPLSVTK